MQRAHSVREAMLSARKRPQDPDARAEVARAWLALGKPEVARTWAMEAVRMKPGKKAYEALLQEIAAAGGQGAWGEEGPTALVRFQTGPDPWEVAATDEIGGPAPPSLDSQMNALFGGALFDEQTSFLPPSIVLALRPAPKRGRGALRLLIAGITLAAVAVGLLTNEIVKRRELAHVSQELEGFLRTGSVEEARPVMEKLQGLAKEGETQPIVVRAEAMLYHYLDQDEGRRDFIERALPAMASDTYDAVVARALIASEEDLPKMRADLERVAEGAEDPEAAFLLAVISQKRKRYEAAVDLEPSHLPHLAHLARWYLGNEKRDRARDVLDQMRTVNPESRFTRMVEEEVED